MPYEAALATGTVLWLLYVDFEFILLRGGWSLEQEHYGMITSLERMYPTTYFERGQTTDGTGTVDHTAALCPVFPTCAELCGVPIAKHEWESRRYCVMARERRSIQSRDRQPRPQWPGLGSGDSPGERVGGDCGHHQLFMLNNYLKAFHHEFFINVSVLLNEC